MRGDFRQRYGAAFVAILAIAVVAAVLTSAPSYVAFSTSIGLAIAWCIWLERHPAP